MRRKLQILGLLLFLVLFGWLLLLSPLFGLMVFGEASSMLQTGLYVPPSIPLTLLAWFVTGAWYLNRNDSVRAVSDMVPVLRPALTMSVAMLVGLTLTDHVIYLLLQAGAFRALAWLAAGLCLVVTRLALSWWYDRRPLTAGS